MTHPNLLSHTKDLGLEIFKGDKTGYRIYVDTITGENCRQFRLLTWNSFICQFVHPVRVDKECGYLISLF